MSGPRLSAITLVCLLGACAGPAVERTRTSSSLAAPPAPLTFGLFIAAVEEGGRMFTPIRLVPFEHPDSLSHEFPNAMQQHIDEVRAEEHLGRLVGLHLRATIRRYPRPPAETWRYDGEFAPPEIDRILAAEVHHVPFDDSPVVGLRALAVVDGRPTVFITDTRGLTLAERGMTRPTTSGIDLTRAEFLAGLTAVAAHVPPTGAHIIVVEDR